MADQWYRIFYTDFDGSLRSWVAEKPWPADELIDDTIPVTSTSIPFSEVSAEDIVTILESRLENLNYHSLIGLPQALLDIANDACGPEAAAAFMRLFYTRRSILLS